MKGYTLIEVVMAVSLMVIILLGGTTVFYQNLKTSGLSDVDLNLSSSLRSLMSSLENDIRFGQVTGVGTGTRTDCLGTSGNGYSGTTLEVSDLQGFTTIYSLEDEAVASTSAETGRKETLTPSEIKIDELRFTWFCRGNVSDKVQILINATAVVLGSGIEVSRSVSNEVNLLNSGIN